MLGVNMLPEGVDLSSLPMNDEELEVNMQDYKLNSEIDIELGIKHHLTRNIFPTIKEQLDFYLTVLPVSATWVGLDCDGLPVIKTRNPAKILASRSEYGNFKRLPYCGYADEFTVTEFKKIASPYYDAEQLKSLINKYSKRGNYTNRPINQNYSDMNRDVDTIAVLHFEVATTDELVYLEKTDSYGNPRFIEKPFDYYRKPSEQEKFKKKYNGARAVHRKQYPTVYSGYWIIGSDEVFGYGESNYLNGELGYILRATNLHEGKSTCLMKQMIPSLDQLQTYDKKIQQIVSSAIPKGVFIDLFALRNAAFKMGDVDMTPDRLLEMYFQKGILVGDTGQSMGSGSTYKPVIELENGMSKDVTFYLELMRHELEVLDEVIGYNKVSAASTLSAETGARVAQQMDQATDTALDHIYRADKAMCHDIYSALGRLHMVSVRMNPEYYIPIFGEAAVARILKSSPYAQIGIDVEAIPTQAEWNEFYGEMNEMVKAGKLEPEDKAALRRCNSLKQAYSLLKVLTRRRKKEMMESQMMLVDQNAQVQGQSAEQSFKNNMRIQEGKIQGEIAKDAEKFKQDAVRHMWKIKELQAMAAAKTEGDLMVTDLEGENELEAIALDNKTKPKPKPVAK
jgi:hypothetical protein